MRVRPVRAAQKGRLAPRRPPPRYSHCTLMQSFLPLVRSVNSSTVTYTPPEQLLAAAAADGPATKRDPDRSESTNGR